VTSAQQATLMAAQLHEAAQDMACVAARRSARAEGQTAAPSVGQRLELTEDPVVEDNEAADDRTELEDSQNG
jgi:hypothetical protein